MLKCRVLENFAELSAMFRPLRSLPSLQCKLVSRSRTFRSKRHAAGTSSAHKQCLFQNSSFCWSRKELENFEFFRNSKLRLCRFYSCGGFNTPTLCVVTKGIKAECNHLMRTTYPDACVGVVDFEFTCLAN